MRSITLKPGWQKNLPLFLTVFQRVSVISLASVTAQFRTIKMQQGMNSRYHNLACRQDAAYARQQL